ncbi:LacI family DNA-binding transcriptional regulator [Saccharopolyspora sp. HNM0983]|uniref:LacI family DNA-binding transcriptional regulator n=1 Tax=Saccharopolyspora montiporae TaxID=2781240 RepID=A0A929BCP6_9PSEU|nr:LacI family DNA-binding transcriptional regulator [Saccharopolyspora sp. HNM0983]
MSTISDVAARAGVSTATVSRALNGKSTVDPQLAARVRAAAAELGYRPNGPARNLRRQETVVLTLIISDVANPFFTAMARGVEDVAHAAGYSVVLCNSDDDPAKERAYVDIAVQERMAGILVSPTGRGDSAGVLAAQGAPVVAVDRPLPGTPGDTVLVDGALAARQAAEHLVQQGYSRIGCITGPSGVPTADERLAGYRAGLRAARLPAAADLVRRCEFRAQGAYRAALDLVNRDDPPDALLIGNNAMAIGVLEALAELGIRPGREIGLIAFDDAPWAALLDPPLSVVSQPAYDMGTAAAQLLLERIGGASTAARTVTLSAHLIPRASSDPHA